MDNLSHHQNPLTSDDLRDILAEIERAAAQHNLIIIRGLPTNFKPSILWQGDTHSYLQTASLASAALLYIAADPFDLERDNTALSQTQPAQRIQQIRPIDSTDPTAYEQQQWLLARLNEQTEDYRLHNDQIGSIRCAWFANGVSHALNIATSWHTNYTAAIARALEEAESVALEHRRVHDEEVIFFLTEAARDVASHERFSEASNNEKRAYMVDQLYPGLTPQQRTEVVGLAQAIYWWDIAPAENANKEQQVRDMRARGETLRNIAALLKMPETRVKAILES